VLPQLQLIAGLGYGGARYQYTVVDDHILFPTSHDVTDSLGSGAAQLATVRFLFPPLFTSFHRFDLALEARYTRIALDPHGVIQGGSVDFVVGRF
jgi:hypothetical protein